MTDEQKKIYDLVMENVTDENKDKATKLVKEILAKHEAGTLNQMALLAYVPQITSMIKPESMAQIKELLKNLK